MPPRAVPRSRSLSELRKPPVRTYFDLWLDAEAATGVLMAQVQLDRIERAAMESPDAAGALAMVEQARENLAAKQKAAIEADDPPVTNRFWFQAIGADAYEALKLEHPPKPEQQERVRREGIYAGIPLDQLKAEFDLETFPPAIVSAASYDPKITIDEALAIFENTDPETVWNEAELGGLFGAAISAQRTRPSARLGE